MAVDTGIVWTDPWATWFGRAGVRLYIPDPLPSQSQVTATVEFYAYGTIGNTAVDIGATAIVFDSNAQQVGRTDFDRTNYKIPGSGSGVVTILLESRQISVPVYYSGQGGSGTFSDKVLISAYVYTPYPDHKTASLVASVPVRPPWPPGQPAAPSLVYSPPSTVTVSYVAPDPGGAPITNYDVQYSLYPDMTNYSTYYGPTSGSVVVTDLSPGNKYYFRIRAYNSMGGGPWSAIASIDVMSGPRVKYGGVYKSTVSYVKVNGVWKVAVPYVKQNGVWRIAGG